MYKGYESFDVTTGDDSLVHPERTLAPVGSLLALTGHHLDVVEEAARRGDWDTFYHALRNVQGNAKAIADRTVPYVSPHVLEDAERMLAG